MHMSDHDFDGFDDLCTPWGGKKKTRARLSRGGREGKKNEREILWPSSFPPPPLGVSIAMESFYHLSY